eukprot:m.10244 g.10244  ORF g.10244 m.10244 type:complete len:272 (-) comp5954_c0_seq1:520-1335(-)
MDLDALLDDVEELLDTKKGRNKDAKQGNSRQSPPARSIENNNDYISSSTSTSSNAADLTTTSSSSLSTTLSTTATASSNTTTNSSSSSRGRDRRQARGGNVSTSKSDIDLLLQDLETTVSKSDSTASLSSLAGKAKGKPEKPEKRGDLSTTSAPPPSANKCSVIILTDAHLDRGVCVSAAFACTCSTLRCTSCDHAVCCFDNLRWDDSADYLFFRNNTPDYGKLKVLLHRAKGGRAYACQCAWRSVPNGEREVIARGGKLKWVCGRHSRSS